MCIAPVVRHLYFLILSKVFFCDKIKTATEGRRVQLGHPFSHKLGECAISFFVTKKLEKKLKGDFPQCLDGAPLLLPSSGNQLRSGIDKWLDKQRIHPRMIAEFDDSALMKAFGQEGAGIFIAPSAIEAEVEWQYQVMAIGRVDEVKEHFYAISVERRVMHPVAATVVEAARESLFADESSWDE